MAREFLSVTEDLNRISERLLTGGRFYSGALESLGIW